MTLFLVIINNYGIILKNHTSKHFFIKPLYNKLLLLYFINSSDFLMKISEYGSATSNSYLEFYSKENVPEETCCYCTTNYLQGW